VAPSLQCISRERKQDGVTDRKSDEGKVGWVILWLLGLPLPILLILFLLRGCT
jgi:hypothetical protein